MSPMFVSPSNWPIFQNWLLIQKDGFRYVALRDGQGLKCRSTRQVRLVELTGASTKATETIVEKEIDRVCNEPAITKQEAFSDEACRRNLEFTIPKMQEYLKWKLSRNTRLFAVLGRSAGEATIKAFDNRKEKARLSLTVAETIKVPAAFHTVRHLANGKKPFVQHSRTIDKNSTLMALAFVNGILRQAAISFDFHTFGHADIDMDLGKTVDVRKMSGPEVVAIRAKGSRSTIPNVFTVGRIWNNGGTAGSTFEKRDIIIDNHEDDYSFARTLAHEFGHVLDLGHVFGDLTQQKRVEKKGNVVKYKVPPTENLMGAGDDEGLNKSQIGLMRTKARSLIARQKK